MGHLLHQRQQLVPAIQPVSRNLLSGQLLVCCLLLGKEQGGAKHPGAGRLSAAWQTSRCCWCRIS
jgi:hypothetical protein